ALPPERRRARPWRDDSLRRRAAALVGDAYLHRDAARQPRNVRAAAVARGVRGSVIIVYPSAGVLPPPAAEVFTFPRGPVRAKPIGLDLRYSAAQDDPPSVRMIRKLVSLDCFSSM